MLGKYLNIKKNELGLTNQEISDLSKVPKSTVDRILRSDDCSSTNLETAAALVKAIGGSLDEAMGITPPLRLTPEDIPDDTPDIISRVGELVDKVQRMHHAVHREKDAITADSMKFRTRVLIGSLLVNAVFAALLIYDLTHPKIGWAQYDTLSRIQQGLAASWTVCSVWCARFI